MELDKNSINIVEAITLDIWTTDPTTGGHRTESRQGVLLWSAANSIVMTVSLWDNEKDAPGHSWIIEREHSAKALNGFPMPASEHLMLAYGVMPDWEDKTKLRTVLMLTVTSAVDKFSPNPYVVVMDAFQYQGFLSLTHSFVPVGKEDISHVVDEAIQKIFAQ